MRTLPEASRPFGELVDRGVSRLSISGGESFPISEPGPWEGGDPPMEGQPGRLRWAARPVMVP